MCLDMNICLFFSVVVNDWLFEVLIFKLVYLIMVGQDQVVQMVLEGQGFYSGKLVVGVFGCWLVLIEDFVG